MNVDSLYGRDDAMPLCIYLVIIYIVSRISGLTTIDLDTFHQNTTIRVGLGMIHYLFTISNCYIPFYFTISLFPSTYYRRVEEEC